MPKEKIYQADFIQDDRKQKYVDVRWGPESNNVELYIDNGSPFRFVNDSGDYTGLAAHLDRDGCNRLIRAIRKARDHAFGADA